MFSFIVVLACGLFALYYAYDTSKRVFSAGTGTEEMQKIAGAIQEGAQAYLNRQYKTIAIVGVIVAVLLAWALSGLRAWRGAVRRRRLHRHERFRACQHPYH